LPELAINLQEADELTMLKYVLNERDMELAAEGKRWYDLMRLGKSKNYKYKNEFIQMVIANNKTASQSWLRSVLKNEYAWYLPIFQDELEANELLKQNPYYDVTNQ
jgi:F0F1-type ATP synthase alpha subunit